MQESLTKREYSKGMRSNEKVKGNKNMIEQCIEGRMAISSKLSQFWEWKMLY